MSANTDVVICTDNRETNYHSLQLNLKSILTKVPPKK